jgi:hypothetical protein
MLLIDMLIAGKIPLLCNMYTKEQIDELEQYFKSVSLPEDIRLSRCEMVIDVPKFINSSLASCRANMGVKIFESAYDRLITLKELLQKQ